MQPKTRKKHRSKRSNRVRGFCIWNNIELLFDVAKSGVGDRNLNKLDLRILAARRELQALRRRGIEDVELIHILNRNGCTRKIGLAEIDKCESDLRSAFQRAASQRTDLHTIEVPRWIMVGLSTGKFTVARGVALLFYLYRRLVKSKSHFKNWVKVGQGYGRFKLTELKEWCGIHLSRGSAALRWLQEVGILRKVSIPFFERMKRGGCYVDGLLMKENGNQFGHYRKPCHSKPKNHKTYKETYKKKAAFDFREDEYGRLVAIRS